MFKKLTRTLAFTSLAILVSTHAVADDQKRNLHTVQYKQFTVVLDCDTNLPMYVTYKLTKDKGNFKRSSSFYSDNNVPKDCQQTSTGTYKLPYKIDKQHNKKISYDRGHLSPANDHDNDKEAIKETNFMTNIVPMDSFVNRHGAWKQTEVLAECTRDVKDIEIHAGVIIGDDTNDDYFTSSHNVPTPDRLWKILTDGENVIAWIIPNKNTSLKENLDSYRVSIQEIEQQAKILLPFKSNIKLIKKQSHWPMPKPCDWS